MEEKIVNIEVKNIKDFPKHPFNVKKDINYFELEESIIENGVLIPAIVRKTKTGEYEMVSGHRRKNICIENNIEKIPCIVKDLTDEEAIIFMVDTNLQREKILPSEKARAYKMKYDLLRYKDKLSPVGTNEKDSRTQIYRYIRLNYLIPELMQLVDDTVLKDKRSALTMGIRPAIIEDLQRANIKQPLEIINKDQ
ncbi:MAG: ParB/RepB/Spo0J family partition protein [Mollicutes bacterium]|nr:ParB/RepB/Spo0J family partition protein [Mollicutes bacterium]